MNVDINPDYARTCMRLWRESVDLKVPMVDEFKIHMMTQRRTILGNFEATAGSWLMVLRQATPSAADAEAWAEFLAEIMDFEAWAKGEIEALEADAVREEIAAGMEDLLRDPAFRDQLFDLARKLPRSDGNAVGE